MSESEKPKAPIQYIDEAARRATKEKYPGLSGEEIQERIVEEQIKGAGVAAGQKWEEGISESFSRAASRLGQERLRQLIVESYNTALEELRKYRDEFMKRTDGVKE